MLLRAVAELIGKTEGALGQSILRLDPVKEESGAGIAAGRWNCAPDRAAVLPASLSVSTGATPFAG
jgi:hypothetical protein